MNEACHEKSKAMRQLMLKIMLEKGRFRDPCHPQNHSEQCFVCSWQKNWVILYTCPCYAIPPLDVVTYLLAWLIYLIVPYQNRKDTIYTRHAYHHLKAYTLMSGIMHKMVIAIKLSLFPLLGNKHCCRKCFEKVDRQSALLSQWLNIWSQ